MSNSFEKDVIKAINNFRKLPASLIKPCENVQMGLSRLKSNDPFLKEIQTFIDSLGNMKSMPTLEYNEVLSEAAGEEMKKFISQSRYEKIKSSPYKLKGIVPQNYMEANPVLIADEGADEPVNVLTKILLDKQDRSKIGRSILTDPKYTQIGISYSSSEGENYVIMIFAEFFVEEETYKLPEGDLSELKRAFDILDQDKKLKLNMPEVMAILNTMKYSETNPTLYNIFKDLNDSNQCSWPKFASVVHEKMSDRETKKGLQRIFNLFIDNPEKKTIDFPTLKHICEEINLKISEDKLREIMKNVTANGNEINYEEFERVMLKSQE